MVQRCATCGVSDQTGKGEELQTTVIRRVAAALAGKRLGGQERTIAHVDFPKRQRVGKYGVDVSALDEIVGSALAPDPAVAVYLVDEIWIADDPSAVSWRTKKRLTRP